MGGSDGASVIGQGYYTDTSHYDRMPIPIPIVPAPPLLHRGGMHSEDEIEPAYATVFPTTNMHHSNPNVNMSQPQQQIDYQAEDRSIYRRGARRWRKLYRINGHIFQAKRFNRVSFVGWLLQKLSIDPEFISSKAAAKKTFLSTFKPKIIFIAILPCLVEESIKQHIALVWCTNPDLIFDQYFLN